MLMFSVYNNYVIINLASGTNNDYEHKFLFKLGISKTFNRIFKIYSSPVFLPYQSGKLDRHCLNFFFPFKVVHKLKNNDLRVLYKIKTPIGILSCLFPE